MCPAANLLCPCGIKSHGEIEFKVQNSWVLWRDLLLSISLHTTCLHVVIVSSSHVHSHKTVRYDWAAPPTVPRCHHISSKVTAAIRPTCAVVFTTNCWKWCAMEAEHGKENAKMRWNETGLPRSCAKKAGLTHNLAWLYGNPGKNTPKPSQDSTKKKKDTIAFS
jgi:hypothetical protein